MNAKLLYVTTLVLALASSWALADEAPVALAAGIADVRQPAGAAGLHRTDYDDELAARPAPGSQLTREQVVTALKSPRDPRIVGPLRSRTYNPYGTETMREPIYTRAQVRADVLEARAEHALRPAGEAGDLSLAGTPRREAPASFAGRFRRGGS